MRRTDATDSMPVMIHDTVGIFAALILLLFIGWIPEAFAYRPFASTDADVSDPGELEIEWGAFTLEHEDDNNAYIVPDLVFNLGLSHRTEIIGEFKTERTFDNQWELADAGTFVKTVWREGILQGRSVMSIATVAGALLPGTASDEDGFGAEGIIIVSTRVRPFTLHINAGGGITRVGSESFATGGIIAEYPISRAVQLVSEVSGEVISGEELEASLLLGAIWSPDWFEGNVDFGIRGGLTNEAPDWAVTLGATIPFRNLLHFQ